MGGTGSGRKARDKSKATKADFKPAHEKAEPEEQRSEVRHYSVPAHVSGIRTTAGCRFGG